mgnify:CR=1 FL=1
MTDPRIKQFYEENVQLEWERFMRHPVEFEITTRMLDPFLKPGQTLLDIGGGPGRYALRYAERGLDVTLVDLSKNNVAFALDKAAAQGLSIRGLAADALDVDKLLPGQHVFLMGPLYHLLEEEQRREAVRVALALTKPGGMLYCSFLVLFSGIIFFMSEAPAQLLGATEKPFLDALLQNKSYAGAAFTQAYFCTQGEILPFMQDFGLEDLRLFGQEGILAQMEPILLQQTPEVQAAWFDVAHQLCEQPEYLSYSEHLMAFGRKPG